MGLYIGSAYPLLNTHTHTHTRARARTHIPVPRKNMRTDRCTRALDPVCAINPVPPSVVHAGAQAIAAGSHHSMVLKTDGSVWGTGKNYYGQLGDGTRTDRKVFKKVVSSG